ncbi:MAG: exo-beta-N-acetylmuramidase NamZ domain-containing protein [Sandaracinaceae bacterium]
MSPRVVTGLERVALGEVRLEGRVGLLAHPASVDVSLTHTSSVLRRSGVTLHALFGPEHGYGGEAQDMIAVGEARDPSGAPIYSLYGSTEETLSPSPEQLSLIDTLVVDLADVGSRYYTYVWTAALALKAAARAGVRTVILDRPNPLGGAIVEGGVQRPGHRSFVGLYDVAVRHGMTLAEIVNMVAKLEGIDAAAFSLVTMRGWSRATRWEDTGLPWVHPSPNMPTLDTARVYPGGCLLEGTELSEGRGTTKPFEIWGAPGLDGRALAERVEAPGAILRPLTFTPSFHKHAGQIVGGVQVHVTDPDRFRSYETYLAMIAEAARQLGDRFRWRHAPYEFVAEIPAIDLLTGGPELREAIAGDRAIGDVIDAERAGAEAFARTREPWLLYR